MKKLIRWALIGTGGISNAFVRGLRLVNGACAYAVVSRDPKRAAAFAAQYGIPKVYDDYDAMLNDGAVDVVYIGVPHSEHKRLAEKAFAAHKAVLCEKPAALNAAELSSMIACARKHQVFFMEALWSRFVPPVIKAREWLADGLAGEIRLVQANFGFMAAVAPEHRLLNLKLGGGATLDLGVYPLSFAAMVFGGQKPRSVQSLLTLGKTGVDMESTALIDWGPHKTAQLYCALSLSTVNDLWLYGTEGYIHLPSFVFCHSAELACAGRPVYHWEGDFWGNGYNYEAQAVSDCVREGKLECEIMPLSESLVIASIMDAIRLQHNFRYPCETSVHI